MSSSAKNKDKKKSFFGNLFKKKKVTNRPAYVPSIHPKMSHNNIQRMSNMSKVHAAAMNKYNQASEGFVPLSAQLQPPNTLYGQLPSQFNTYAKVTTTKQDRERNKLISRIRKSFNDNESIKTKIMSRLISNEDNIKSLNNLNSMNNSLIRKINRLIPVYENNSTEIRPGASMSESYRQSSSNPDGENGSIEYPSTRNTNNPSVYAALALGSPTKKSTVKRQEKTNYGTIAGTQTNSGQISPLSGQIPTREEQELLLQRLIDRGNATVNINKLYTLPLVGQTPQPPRGGGYNNKKRTHKKFKSKSKSRKHKK
jgi:hypothetical protein